MTNTTSAFGRELDSLADIISFGLAPTILAVTWGVQFVAAEAGLVFLDQLRRAGMFVAFLFLVCGAARLARFNIQTNPVPKNPGNPRRKYFVGLPIPAAAGMVAVVVYFFDGYPIVDPAWCIGWELLLALLAFLMVSTWRYWSFKELNLLRPRSPLILVLLAGIIYLIWTWSQPVVLIIASTYVASGIAIRLAGLVRRYARRTPRAHPETQLG
jgi:CDP-diacylglycerol--serine O-phosphatidyltransferase